MNKLEAVTCEVAVDLLLAWVADPRDTTIDQYMRNLRSVRPELWRVVHDALVAFVFNCTIDELREMAGEE